MVEITYQMVLSTLQTIALIVGIYYYIMTIRANQRNQEISLKNQQLSSVHRILEVYRDPKRILQMARSTALGVG
jgi:replicative DNA helicase